MTNPEQKIKNNFLAVNKGYYDFGFKASTLIIVSAIEEFKRNKQPCYLTNEQFAYMTKESTRSIVRILDVLEQHNIIRRFTSKSKGKQGKQRTIELLPIHQWIIPIVYQAKKDTNIEGHSVVQNNNNKRHSVTQNDDIKGHSGTQNDIFKRQNGTLLNDTASLTPGHSGTIKDKEKNKEKDNNIYALTIGAEPSASADGKRKEATPEDQVPSASLDTFLLGFFDDDEI